MTKWYRYDFEDGFVTVRGKISNQELQKLANEHGRLISKVFDCEA